MANAREDFGIPYSTLCPKYLHANSTSHTWPFSAIAELIDNAYDPDVEAKQFWIDKITIKKQMCLSFMDNGNGLNYENMHRMLSFGYSDKVAKNGHQPIGLYGNGFKSGSMRLGRDAIVFSKSRDATVVGLLSQSYLEKIKVEQIIVPIISVKRDTLRDHSIMSGTLRVSAEHKPSLQAILCHSLFKTEEELLMELNAINSTCSTSSTGTRIIIWNLRSCTTPSGSEMLEFDFEKERYDIQIPSDVYEGMNENSRHSELTTQSIPESIYSLRAYCSILYMKPRMQIIICGLNVKTKLISKSLAYIQRDIYKPLFLKKGVPIVFGYNTQSKDYYGIMMYYKNRLIKAYERVGCQNKGNTKGVGVIGVIECNFLEPTHNKQDFINSEKYRNATISLGRKLEEYWKEMCLKRKQEHPTSQTLLEDMPKRPDQNWVQCDSCLKWRKLPDGIDSSRLPDKWFCNLNPNSQFRSCLVEEEKEDSDDERPYKKMHKLLEKQDKLKEAQKKIVRAQVHAKSASTTPVVRGKARLRHRGARKEDYFSPTASSSKTNLPIISGVVSLSTPSWSGLFEEDPENLTNERARSGLFEEDPENLTNERARVKRALPMTTENESKKPRANGFHSAIPETASPGPTVSPSSSTSTLILQDMEEDNDDYDNDDDIFILEAKSTPLSKEYAVDFSKIKTERQSEMEENFSAFEGPSTGTNPTGKGSIETAALGTIPSPPAHVDGQQVSFGTQIGGHARIKDEEKGVVEGKSNETGPMQKEMASEGAGDAPTVDSREEGTEQPLGETGEARTYQSVSVGEPRCCNIKEEDSSLPVIHNRTDFQEQQDQLMELLQSAANERDSFEEQVNQLTARLRDREDRLQVLTSSSQKECTQQATQTEETGRDYKTLYEQGQRVAEVLRIGKVDLQQTSSAANSSENDPEICDELALQADAVLRDLDQINKQRDELQSQVEALKQEEASLASQCNLRRCNLESLRKEVESGPSAPAGEGVVSHPKGEAGGMGHQEAASVVVGADILTKLRRNVGRLLVTFVPALDLDQVNYECNVIDEILEQVLTDVESVSETL